jgi:hypothetical protein
MEDQEFLARFESGVLSPAEFGHRSHVRLAYLRLRGNDVETACSKVRHDLVGFLSHHGIAPEGKYHETLTRAWILAVRHFMASTPKAASAAELMEAHPKLLDSSIMLRHYSRNVLYSEKARQTFIEPDLAPIPCHEDSVR